MNAQVQVTRKELSNGLQAVLVIVNGVEGMTLPDVIRTLGIPEQTVRDYIKTNNCEFPRFSVETLQQLRTDNVISMVGRPPKFVSKEIVKDLVRFYSNEKTDAIYKQLWDVVQAVHAGDFVQAANTVGMTNKEVRTHLRKALDDLDIAEAKIEELTQVVENQKVIVGKLSLAEEFTNAHPMKRASKSVWYAVDVIKQFPAVVTIATDYCKYAGYNLDRYGPTGCVTSWLRDVHGFHKDLEMKKMTAKGPAYAYDPGEIITLMADLNIERKGTK